MNETEKYESLKAKLRKLAALALRDSLNDVSYQKLIE